MGTGCAECSKNNNYKNFSGQHEKIANNIHTPRQSPQKQREKLSLASSKMLGQIKYKTPKEADSLTSFFKKLLSCDNSSSPTTLLPAVKMTFSLKGTLGNVNILDSS